MTRLNVLIGVFALGLACVLAFVWIPLDVASGAFVERRQQHLIGDSFAPLVAAGLIGLSGALLMAFERNKPVENTISVAGLQFVAMVVALLVLGVLAMSHAASITLSIADWLSGQDRELRLLRDDMPWKYVGYILGGTLMVAGLMSAVHRRFHWRHLAIGFASAVFLAALFDLPFDDLLLPPNGDF